MVCSSLEALDVGALSGYLIIAMILTIIPRSNIRGTARSELNGSVAPQRSSVFATTAMVRPFPEDSMKLWTTMQLYDRSRLQNLRRKRLRYRFAKLRRQTRWPFMGVYL